MMADIGAAASHEEDEDGAFQPFERINSDGDPSALILCDHASNALPPGYGTLGLNEADFHRHIAYDIGAGDVARRLAGKLGVPGILAGFSRLLIDPNRGIDDPTLVMRLSDGVIIPANRHVDEDEIAYRTRRYHEPYHDAIRAALARARSQDVTPAIVSIHSFTPLWRGWARPWHVGILWDRDPRLAVPLIEALKREDGLVVGDNQPYSGRLVGDCMNEHGTRNGLPHALVEIRQDLIDTHHGAEEWAERLRAILVDVLVDPRVRAPIGDQ